MRPEAAAATRGQYMKPRPKLRMGRGRAALREGREERKKDGLKEKSERESEKERRQRAISLTQTAAAC